MKDLIINLEVTSLNGVNGFKISGQNGEYSGTSVASAGDINGDGIDDLIIGAPKEDANNQDEGASYIVFGTAGGFGANLDVSTLDGTNGFRITGEANLDKSGTFVAAAGDINNDGYADVIIGAQDADPNGAASGASYVVFGKAAGFTANFDLSTLDGTNGFQMNGEAADDQSGVSVASAGDVNGDGFDDVIIGAFKASPNGGYSGSSYVVFGAAGGFAANLELSSLDGTTGFKLNGEAANDRSGFSVASAGDINGDGFDDLIVGAYYASPTGQYSGASYIVFGKASGFTPDLELSSLDGTNGFKINGAAKYDNSGFSVATAGDINGDGFDDVVVGARYGDAGNSANFVVFGKASGFTATFELSGLDGTDGFRILSDLNGDQIGRSATSAGDVNGDGYNDLILGSRGADPHGSYSGASYVVFGSASGFAADFDLTDIDGLNGFQINGEAANDYLGWAVSSAGDVNDDGFDDIVIGAPRADPNSDVGAGASYVVYGRAVGALNRTGTAQADILSGGDWDDTFTGLGGSDHIRSGAGIDVIFGGAGADLLDGGNGKDTISGGAGGDRIMVSAGRDSLNGNGGADWLDFSNLGSAKVDVDLSTGSFILAGTGERQTFTRFENVAGGSGNDTLTGNYKANEFDGGLGKDVLNGRSGDDTLTGGGGNDIFVFASRTGTDTITDFANGTDRIDLSGLIAFTSFADLVANHLVKSGSDVIIQYGNDEFVLENVTKAQITLDDFIL